MTEPTTPTGKRLRDDERQHGSGCDDRRAGWCRCGQTENLATIEAEAKALGVAERHSQLRSLLPGLNALLALDAADFGRVIAERPDVYVVLRAFLAEPQP
jgi:hypothetical protein